LIFEKEIGSRVCEYIVEKILEGAVKMENWEQVKENTWEGR